MTAPICPLQAQWVVTKITNVSDDTPPPVVKTHKVRCHWRSLAQCLNVYMFHTYVIWVCMRSCQADAGLPASVSSAVLTWLHWVHRFSDQRQI